MTRRGKALALAIGVFIAGLLFYSQPPRLDDTLALPDSPEAIARGRYLVSAGGCISCHAEVDDEGERVSEQLSGGHALATDFGTFFAPNITPDADTGIGAWDAQDFLLAMKHGRSPDGSFYYPAFPYRSYAGLSDADVLDIGAYLMSLEPVSNVVAEHSTPWWLSRLALIGWNFAADVLEGEAKAMAEDDQPERALIERGAYLARSLGHCGECHTPRNGLGITTLDREFAGASLGDEVVEAIDSEALAEWTREGFDLFLLLGMKPDADFVGGDMNEVIEHNTSRLTDEDRLALAAFFTR